MLEATGNLWTYPADLRVITTNGSVRRDGAAVMGRGCAFEAKQRYPGIEMILGDRLNKHGNHVTLLGPHLASFPVKNVWMNDAIPELIVRSAHELVALADRHWNYRRIVLPRPGCGNGHLRWTTVRPFIENILDGRFTIITFDRSL